MLFLKFTFTKLLECYFNRWIRMPSGRKFLVAMVVMCNTLIFSKISTLINLASSILTKCMLMNYPPLKFMVRWNNSLVEASIYNPLFLRNTFGWNMNLKKPTKEQMLHIFKSILNFYVTFNGNVLFLSKS